MSSLERSLPGARVVSRSQRDTCQPQASTHRSPDLCTSNADCRGLHTICLELLSCGVSGSVMCVDVGLAELQSPAAYQSTATRTTPGRHREAVHPFQASDTATTIHRPLLVSQIAGCFTHTLLRCWRDQHQPAASAWQWIAGRHL